MIETIIGVVSTLGTVVNTANGVIELVQKVKGIMQKDTSPQAFQNSMQGQKMPKMKPFQASMQDCFQGGKKWLPQLKNLAGQFGNSWVAPKTMGIMGINLTGIWSPPNNPYDQTYIRQYGPYLNVIAGIGGMPTFYGEGIFNPSNFCLHVVGKNMNGVFGEAQARVFPNWTIQGVMIMPNAWGMPMQMPLMMMKVG